MLIKFDNCSSPTLSSKLVGKYEDMFEWNILPGNVDDGLVGEWNNLGNDENECGIGDHGNVNLGIHGYMSGNDVGRRLMGGVMGGT